MENLDYHMLGSFLILLGISSFIVQQMAFTQKDKTKVEMKMRKMSGEK